jgi:hypothetical protein
VGGGESPHPPHSHQSGLKYHTFRLIAVKIEANGSLPIDRLPGLLEYSSPRGIYIAINYTHENWNKLHKLRYI